MTELNGQGELPLSLEHLLEAMLFLGGPPLTWVRAAEVIHGLTLEQFTALLADLSTRYRRQGRPYRIARRETANPEKQGAEGQVGYELELRPAFRPILERFHGGTKETRLSQPALDTLALIAYCQPVTRQEVEGHRGGDSLVFLRQLVRLGLVVVQRADEPSGDPLYTTTRRFLQLFSLRSLEDLPRPQELERL